MFQIYNAASKFIQKGNWGMLLEDWRWSQMQNMRYNILWFFGQQTFGQGPTSLGDRVVIKNVFYVKNKQTCILSKKTRFFGFLCFFPPLGQWLIENRITAKYSSNSIRYWIKHLAVGTRKPVFRPSGNPDLLGACRSSCQALRTVSPKMGSSFRPISLSGIRVNQC